MMSDIIRQQNKNVAVSGRLCCYKKNMTNRRQSTENLLASRTREIWIIILLKYSK